VDNGLPSSISKVKSIVKQHMMLQNEDERIDNRKEAICMRERNRDKNKNERELRCYDEYLNVLPKIS